MGAKHNLMCGVAIAALSTSGALADDSDFSGTPPGLPAVSGINGKLAGSGGIIDDEARAAVVGTITVPVGHDFGFQLDGNLGTFDDDMTGAVMSHFFMRDPSSHLFGVAAMYQSIGSNDIFRVGPEVEFYLDRFSIEFVAGLEDSDNADDDFFAVANVAYYLSDNFRISAGYSRSIGIDAAQVGMEWMPGIDFIAPFSIFAHAQFGEDDHDSVWAGIRFYFSGDPGKSLIRRHREDDPQTPFQQLERSDNDAAAPPPIVDAVKGPPTDE